MAPWCPPRPGSISIEELVGALTRPGGADSARCSERKDDSARLEIGLPNALEGEPVRLAAGEELTTPEVLQLAAACGFMGTPVDTDGHYWGKQLAANGAVGTDGRKVTLSGLGNDAKSAVAEQFSKQLGLRSG